MVSLNGNGSVMMINGSICSYLPTFHFTILLILIVSFFIFTDWVFATSNVTTFMNAEIDVQHNHFCRILYTWLNTEQYDAVRQGLILKRHFLAFWHLFIFTTIVQWLRTILLLSIMMFVSMRNSKSET